MPQVEIDARERVSLIATAFKLKFIAGLLIGSGVAACSAVIAKHLLHDDSLQWPILLLSVTYPIGLLGLMVFGLANASKDLYSTTLYSITSALTGLILFVVLCPTFGTFGALMGVAGAPVITSTFALMFARRRSWWVHSWWMTPFSSRYCRLLLSMLPAAAINTIGTPLVQIVLRDQLADRAGLDAVGYVQTLGRLTDLYLGVVSTLFLVYYLRRFSEIKERSELKSEVLRSMRFVLPVVSLVAFALYLSRDLVIFILLTPAFSPMRELFGWQMFGSIFQVIGLMFFYLLTAKLKPSWGIPFHMSVYIFWWLVGSWLISNRGAIGYPQAYAATSIFQAIVGYLIFLWICRTMPDSPKSKL